MDLPIALMDKKINVQMPQSFLRGVYLPNALLSDVCIPNICRYPFVTEHSLSDDGAEGDNETLTVESLHVYHPVPHLGSSATLFVSVVDSFSYSMAHKCDNVVGEALFAAVVELCEGIDRIGADETLLGVLDRVVLRYTGHDYS